MTTLTTLFALLLPIAAAGDEREIVLTIGDGQGGFGFATNLGRTLSSVGDIDGNGVVDIAAGTTGFEEDVFILRRGLDGNVMGTVWISPGAGGFGGNPTTSFGESLAGIGDIDGDGIGDLVATAPNYSFFQQIELGEMWVLFLNSNGTVKDWTEIDVEGAGGFTGPLTGHPFADAVGGAGDVDGNGVPDLVMRAGGAISTTPTEIWLFFLNSDGTILDETVVRNVALDDTGYGTSLCGVGDLDGNGVPDVAIGAPRDSTVGPDHGSVDILFLNADGSLAGSAVIDDSSGPLAGLLVDDEEFGVDVESIGDLNGDGIDDLAVSSVGPVPGNSRVFLLELAPTGAVSAVEVIEPGGAFPVCPDTDLGVDIAGLGPFSEAQPAGVALDAYGGEFVIFDRAPHHDLVTNEVSIDDVQLPELAPLADLGARLAALGDFDGNGVQDVAALMPDDSTAFSSAGAIVLLKIESDGSLASSSTIYPGDGMAVLTRYDELAGPGDIDGDGVADLLVSDDGFSDEVHVFFLHPDGTVRETQEISNEAGGLEGVLGNPPAFGDSIGSVGDVDGDGTPDIAVGEIWGKVWVLRLHPDGTVASYATIEGASNEHTALAGIGDIDGDGVIDLGIGSQFDNELHIALLNADGSAKALIDSSPGQNGFQGGGIDSGFGAAIAGLGDYDGDGNLDVLVGESGTCGNNGGFWILGFAPDGSVVSERRVDIRDPSLDAATVEGSFGAAICVLDEVAGAKRVAFGAPNHPGPDFSRGAVWIVDLVTPAPATVALGCGINPPGSLTLTDGWPNFGTTVTVGIDNPLGTQTPGSVPLLAVALGADPNTPCGTPLPGYGMSAPGSAGELLIDLGSTLPFFVGPVWAGPGQPSEVDLLVPSNPCHVGLGLFVQGVIYDPFGSIELGLTDGLKMVVGP